MGPCPGTSIPSADRAIEALRHPPRLCEISHRQRDQAGLAELTAIITPRIEPLAQGPPGKGRHRQAPIHYCKLQTLGPADG